MPSAKIRQRKNFDCEIFRVKSPMTLQMQLSNEERDPIVARVDNPR